MNTAYEAVIGLEIHAQLPTRSKLFCSCSTDFGSEPNSHVCPVCLGLPGALPRLNEKAVLLAVRAALALGLELQPESVFARKNYFYPDLPKGYQISQFEKPYSLRGELILQVEGVERRAGITRIHMEEDAGKNVHGIGADSAVDLNRAGTPLIEIVGEPDLRSSAEAAAYMRAVREVLLWAGVNDGNLEEGSLRCDANVSIRPFGQEKYGTRVELKNINSFRFVQRAIDTEIARQTQLLESGGVVLQETRGYDAEQNRTYSLRSKEEAHDYRYFPDPDLPPLLLSPELIERERAAMPELPAQARARLLSEGLPEATVLTLTGHPGICRFLGACRKLAPSLELKKLANFILTEVLRGCDTHGLEARFTVSPTQVVELLAAVESGKISGKQAKEVFAALENSEQTAAQVIESRGLQVVSDTSAFEASLRELLEKNPKQAEGLRAGKKQLAGFFVGQVMKQTGGSADPKVVSEILERLLNES